MSALLYYTIIKKNNCDDISSCGTVKCKIFTVIKTMGKMCLYKFWQRWKIVKHFKK